MWLPGAGVGGEDLTAKSAKGAKKKGLTTEVTKFKSINIRTLRVLRAFVVSPYFLINLTI